MSRSQHCFYLTCGWRGYHVQKFDIPFEIVNIIQAVMVLLISATAILSGYKKKLIIKETKEFEAAAKKEVQA